MKFYRVALAVSGVALLVLTPPVRTAFADAARRTRDYTAPHPPPLQSAEQVAELLFQPDAPRLPATPALAETIRQALTGQYGVPLVGGTGVAAGDSSAYWGIVGPGSGDLSRMGFVPVPHRSGAAPAGAGPRQAVWVRDEPAPGGAVDRSVVVVTDAPAPPGAPGPGLEVYLGRGVVAGDGSVGWAGLMRRRLEAVAASGSADDARWAFEAASDRLFVLESRDLILPGRAQRADTRRDMAEVLAGMTALVAPDSLAAVAGAGSWSGFERPFNHYVAARLRAGEAAGVAAHLERVARARGARSFEHVARHANGEGEYYDAAHVLGAYLAALAAAFSSDLWLPHPPLASLADLANALEPGEPVSAGGLRILVRDGAAVSPRDVLGHVEDRVFPRGRGGRFYSGPAEHDYITGFNYSF